MCFGKTNHVIAIWRREAIFFSLSDLPSRLPLIIIIIFAFGNLIIARANITLVIVANSIQVIFKEMRYKIIDRLWAKSAHTRSFTRESVNNFPVKIYLRRNISTFAFSL